MPTILNNPNGDSSAGYVVGIVVVILLLIILFVFVLPANRDNNLNDTVNRPVDTQPNNVQQPAVQGGNTTNFNSTTTVNVIGATSTDDR